MASTVASLCLSQRRTFWTYVMTINLFSLYLLNFMLHTMLDATGVVLRVHTSMKCDVLISQGRVRTILRWGGHFSYMSKEISSSLQQCKNYKNRARFSKVMINNVLPLFYGSQCSISGWRISMMNMISLWWKLTNLNLIDTEGKRLSGTYTRVSSHVMIKVTSFEPS